MAPVRSSRARVVALLLLLATTTWSGPAGSTAALAADDAPSETTTVPPQADLDFLPGPDAGTPPEDMGDRGGAGQLAMFALVMVGLVVIISLAVRDARRGRERARRMRADTGRDVAGR
jgi:hypothetical protein